MKKFLLSVSVISCFLLLSACGNSSNEEASSSSSVEKSSSTEQVSSTDSEVVGNANLNSEGVLENYPYKLDLDNATYNILSTQRVDGSMTSDPILVIEMEYTNKGSNPQSPYMSFITDFDAQQTDGTTTDSLNGANGQFDNLSDQEAVKMGDVNVNSGKTVKAIIGYTLTQKDRPVTIVHRPSQISGENNGFIIK
ncbi:DUF5067 domain-containing protein [Enterococcus sp. DIV0800]|uniref:DUF5067 domain-containing protein n=1 Tax=unclassified Enterococcus TaxID=2608891 RepID=UPI003D2FDA76